MLKKIKTTVATTLAFLATPAFAIAAENGNGAGNGIENPLQWDTICEAIGGVTTFIIGIAGAVALILLIVGGIQYMSSGGDKIAVEASRGRITAAVVGLLIVFGAYLIINVIGGAIAENWVICQ